MPPTPNDPILQPTGDRQLRDGLGAVGHAFFTFSSLSDVQRAAIPVIARGINALVCAATAAGKTEAVVAPLAWRLRGSQRNAVKGPQLLAIAPTRALVADLAERLRIPFAQLDWRCEAQTSDFAGAAVEPEVLITTPESLDSMLVRRLQRHRGEPVGHLLENIGAVFIDEAHCFDSSVRGDQLIFLLTRLRKLRATALRNGWSADAGVQICAASATIHEPNALATRLLGGAAQAIVCRGSRPIDVMTAANEWRRIKPNDRAFDWSKALPHTTSPEKIQDMVWQVLRTPDCRKILIFVPSRSQCDLLGRDLRRYLSKHRDIWVESHHGSLSREHRQRAETEFRARRDAALVATNTLEVGVDIGDVDVVAVIGAPSDTSALLQRIGRGGRRTGLTRILAIARNSIDGAALASQLVSAAAGELERKQRFCRWDAFPQQAISYIRQNQSLGRSRSALTELARDAWGLPDTQAIAEAVIDAWRNEGRVSELRGKLHLAGSWDHYAEGSESDHTIHSNIRSNSVGVAVRNEATGEIIGDIPATSGTNVTIGGRQHRIVRLDDEITVTPVDESDSDASNDTPQYGGRRRPISETFAGHVRRGCGLEDDHLLIAKIGAEHVAFHFGGELYEAALRAVLPEWCEKSAITGIAVRVTRPITAGELNAFATVKLERFVRLQGLRLLGDEGLGRFAEDAQAAGREAMMQELNFERRFTNWIKTRVILPVADLGNFPQLAALFA
jgi:ATP-dependent Lhr-like helicase